jgi:hypothetical protein
MQRALTSQEIISAGEARETRAAWERARTFTAALYGSSAARVTYSQTTLPKDDHHLRTVQLLAFDASGRPLAYDYTAPWWVEHAGPGVVLASGQDPTPVYLARELGHGLPEALQSELRAFAEEYLGVETLHTWRARFEESVMLTWMFDLTKTPVLPYAAITDQAGATLAGEDIVAAGQERTALARWQGARDYVYTLYGERAVRANVIAFSRYNDNTYDRDIRLDVFDATGTRLFYDLHLPWWERFSFSEADIANYIAEHDPKQSADAEYDAAAVYDEDDLVQGEIEWLATLLLGAEFFDTRHPWDTDTLSYDLTRPPALRFPELWAEDGG